MTTQSTTVRTVHPLLWLAAGVATNLALPLLFSRAAKRAEVQDFRDCHEPGTAQPTIDKSAR